MMPGRFENSIKHDANDVQAFLKHYLADKTRKLLLIGGAGFDPRSLNIPGMVSAAGRDVTTALFLREERSDPPPALLQRASQNLSRLRASFDSATVRDISIFDTDGAVIGGREAVACVNAMDLSAFTDIAVDTSALSIGVSFPIVRRLIGARSDVSGNVHLFACHSPATDEAIVPEYNDRITYPLGFSARFRLDSQSDAARLWLPQLTIDAHAALSLIFRSIEPHDVCPILPFPSQHPRDSDRIAERFSQEFDGEWSVDQRSLLYVSDRNPLDLYRMLRRVYDKRAAVFDETGGSILVLSPMGSKILDLGALLAAIELDLPVAYVEAVQYSLKSDSETDALVTSPTHIWVLPQGNGET